MATAAESQLLYSGESVETMGEIGRLLRSRLAQLARQRALKEGRRLVTEEDVLASADEVFTPEGLASLLDLEPESGATDGSR